MAEWAEEKGGQQTQKDRGDLRKKNPLLGPEEEQS